MFAQPKASRTQKATYRLVMESEGLAIRLDLPGFKMPAISHVTLGKSLNSLGFGHPWGCCKRQGRSTLENPFLSVSSGKRQCCIISASSCSVRRASWHAVWFVSSWGWGATSIWVEARDPAKYPTVPATAPATKNHVAINVHRVEFWGALLENPGVMLLLYTPLHSCMLYTSIY